MSYELTAAQVARSKKNLKGVHPDLVKVYNAALALSDVDPLVTCGPRSVAEQKVLVAKGASQTMNSRHIPGKDGLAKAIDVAFVFGKSVRWDTPLFLTFSKHMKAAAAHLGVDIEWGGDWRTFKDYPHFELSRRVYP